ncbi:MAG TPA: DUF1236 domain-containing protein [Xanthobacteraceae bacterium]|jgi:hypothetical protein
MKRTLPGTASAVLLAGIVTILAHTDASADSGRRLGYTAGRPSVPMGQPGRRLGQPTTGNSDFWAPSRRPAIGAGVKQPADLDRSPAVLRDPPAAAPQGAQFSGSGGKAPDGSIPGGSHVALTFQERNQVRDIVLAQGVAERAEIKLMVGAKVPQEVRLTPLPPGVVNIVPKYKDFDFTIARDRIVIVERRTREIDTMIPF